MSGVICSLLLLVSGAVAQTTIAASLSINLIVELVSIAVTGSSSS
jgi:hypothetical protein